MFSFYIACGKDVSQRKGQVKALMFIKSNNASYLKPKP